MGKGKDSRAKEPGALSTSRFIRYMWLILGFVVAVYDQITKSDAQEFLAAEGGKYEVTPFLNLVSVENSGVAFGLLAGSGLEQYLAVFSLGFCAAIYCYLLVYKQVSIRNGVIAALLFGGALGNGIDRLLHSRVYDFIDFHLLGWHWPAFNVADIAISLAIVLLLWAIFSGGSKPADDGAGEQGQHDQASPARD